jgi:hypothetical protein
LSDTGRAVPVDHHIGAWMKEAMAVLYEHELERNLEQWENGELTAAERRIYIANWVGTAWTVLKTMPEFIRKSFVSTGWLLAKDGSKNHLVKLKKFLKDYDFPRPARDLGARDASSDESD